MGDKSLKEGIECFNKYDDKKREYLKRKILELYHLASYDIFYESNIIDIDDYNNEKAFIDNCISKFEYRIKIINKYTISRFEDCRTSNLLEVNSLEGIIIYCGIDNWDLQDKMYDYLIVKDWLLKYEILFVHDF